MTKKWISIMLGILLVALSLLTFSSPLLGNWNDPSEHFKVTLLGTGSPLLSMERFGPGTLVEAGDETLLFDAGRGTALRLHQANVAPGSVDKLFLTHLHSDHTVGIPDVWLTGSLPTAGDREHSFKVWGPKGTKKMMSHMEKAFAADIEARENSGNGNTEGIRVEATDIKEGVIYQHDGVEVIAFLVDHKSIEPSYGYRINYRGHSVVISGDTRYSENLIHFAKGADLIIHEVAAAKPGEAEKSEAISNILSLHTTPEEAGNVFSQVKPKLAVYTHIVLLGGLKEDEADLLNRTKATYSGQVVVGEDLMSIEVGDKVEVQKE
ncbi:MBL fold metallo-hydrolase [Pseudalkalibacillus decolorationis]|uniref:MBL fold metallo-hydrolase n=1 Tax=Pseudalkalibacillus decolorationis TaxID=163879 RepID=UPI002148BD1F|nr:MBL fold metallo-hydrolase [Pseudalkalibacillus decolorationis]